MAADSTKAIPSIVVPFNAPANDGFLPKISKESSATCHSPIVAPIPVNTTAISAPIIANSIVSIFYK